MAENPPSPKEVGFALPADLKISQKDRFVAGAKIATSAAGGFIRGLTRRGGGESIAGTLPPTQELAGADQRGERGIVQDDMAPRSNDTTGEPRDVEGSKTVVSGDTPGSSWHEETAAGRKWEQEGLNVLQKLKERAAADGRPAASEDDVPGTGLDSARKSLDTGPGWIEGAKIIKDKLDAQAAASSQSAESATPSPDQKSGPNWTLDQLELLKQQEFDRNEEKARAEAVKVAEEDAAVLKVKLAQANETKTTPEGTGVAAETGTPASTTAPEAAATPEPTTTDIEKALKEMSEKDKQVAAYHLWEKVNKYGDQLKTKAGQEALLRGEGVVDPNMKFSESDIDAIRGAGLILGAEGNTGGKPEWDLGNGNIDQKKWDEAVYLAAIDALAKKRVQETPTSAPASGPTPAEAKTTANGQVFQEGSSPTAAPTAEQAATTDSTTPEPTAETANVAQARASERPEPRKRVTLEELWKSGYRMRPVEELEGYTHKDRELAMGKRLFELYQMHKDAEKRAGSRAQRIRSKIRSFINGEQTVQEQAEYYKGVYKREALDFKERYGSYDGVDLKSEDDLENIGKLIGETIQNKKDEKERKRKAEEVIRRKARQVAAAKEKQENPGWFAKLFKRKDSESKTAEPAQATETTEASAQAPAAQEYTAASLGQLITQIENIGTDLGYFPDLKSQYTISEEEDKAVEALKTGAAMTDEQKKLAQTVAQRYQKVLDEYTQRVNQAAAQPAASAVS